MKSTCPGRSSPYSLARGSFTFTTSSAWSKTAPTTSCIPDFAPTGLAVGDFTFNVDEPGTAPPDLAIAPLASCANGDGQVQLFSVDPTNQFALASLDPAFPVFAPVPEGQTALVASDTQGRSLLLCRPEKVAISQHSQPRIVMGAPPMHIDYVQDPAGSSSSFDFANMTAYPSNDQSSVRGMNSEFDLASSSQVQTQSTNTTSYTYSVSDGVNVNLGINIPDIGSLGASMKYAATTTHAGMVEVADKQDTVHSVIPKWWRNHKAEVVQQVCAMCLITRRLQERLCAATIQERNYA